MPMDVFKRDLQRFILDSGRFHLGYVFRETRELAQIGLGQIFGQALVQIDFCPNWSFGLAQVGIGQMKDTTHESVSTTHRAV